jgi:Ni/Co efflux regulator RcnB
MRKAFSAILMAATVLTPLGAVNAQSRDGDTSAERQRDRGAWGAQRPQRQERQERAAPEADRAPRQERAAQEAEAPRGERTTPQVRQQNRGAWGNQRPERPQPDTAPVEEAQEQRQERDRGTWGGQRPSGDPTPQAQPQRNDRASNWPGQDRRVERGRADAAARALEEQRNRDRWRNEWRRDSRYNWQRYRSRYGHLYRMPSYYAPYRDYGYSRFRIGTFIGSSFFHRRYWIHDPWHYRLPSAPPGYQWVRYYDDVLLVDTWNGRVVDVIYNFFW